MPKINEHPRGRPPTTTHEAVASTALTLFAERGFDETTVDDVAGELGIGRRTVFRYFASKNDMVWGDFDWVMDRLKTELEAARAEPLWDAIAHGVVESNRYPPEQLSDLRIRMTLITTVPALQAHSMLRYAAWRSVVAEYVAQRTDEPSDGLQAEVLSHAALGIAMAAFTRWVRHPDEGLADLLTAAFAHVRSPNR